MAKYNEILVGRFNQALQKIFGIKGGAPAPQLSGDIQVSYPLFAGVETRFTERWFRYAFSIDNPAVPGLTTAVRLRNPGGSGVLAVLEKAAIFTGLADDISFRIRGSLGDVDLGTAQTVSAIERRNTGNSSLKVSLDLAGNQQGLAAQLFKTQANVVFDQIQASEEQELVLDPGQWFEWFTITANNRLVVNMIWRERPIEEGELL